MRGVAMPYRVMGLRAKARRLELRDKAKYIANHLPINPLREVIASIPLLPEALLRLRSRRRIFERAFEGPAWGSRESRSGDGSELGATETLRYYLPDLCRRLGIRTIFDGPCGDWNWMRHVDLTNIDYVGADLVRSLIVDNQNRFSRPGVRFIVADLTRDPLDRADLILCRDCWVHLSFRDIAAMLENFRRSGATWLLVSDSPGTERNYDKLTGLSWRYLNLCRPPFNFPPAVERRKDHYAHVHFQISLWRLADLPMIRI
jgi:hypothetical protein